MGDLVKFDDLIGGIKAHGIDYTSQASLFGQTLYPQQKVNLTGSGFTNNFRISSTGTGSSYTVSGFYVDYIPGGRI